LTPCPQRPQVGADLHQLVAQRLPQLVAAGAHPLLRAGNYDYTLSGGANVIFNPGGDGGQLIIGGLSRQTELLTRVDIAGAVPFGGLDLLHRRDGGIFAPVLDDLVDLPLCGGRVVIEHADGVTRTWVHFDVRAVQDPLGQRGDVLHQLVGRVCDQRWDLPRAHLAQPHPHRRVVSGPVVGVQRAVGPVQVDVDGLRLVVGLVPAVQRVRLRHGADLHSGHEGAPLSSLSSGDGEDGGGVAGARAVLAAQPPVDGAHRAADHLRDLADGPPRLAQRREPRDGHLSGRGLLRGGGLLGGPLLGGARGVAALAAVRVATRVAALAAVRVATRVAALAAVRVATRVAALLRLGGGDSGGDRVDDVLPVPVRRREDVQLAVLPKDLATEDAAGLGVGDVLAAQLGM